MRENLTVNSAFPYAPGDKLGVLRTEVEDSNRIVVTCRLGRYYFRPTSRLCLILSHVYVRCGD